VTESVDPDPHASGQPEQASTLGGRNEPTTGDPTAGGMRGQIGKTDTIAADEPDDGGPAIPVGGGHVTEDSNTPPSSGTGPEEPGAGSRAGDGD
jgi:hypothetical protein